MPLPNLTGLRPADVADFDQMLDELPHKFAKPLSAWMDRMIIAQIERNRVFEVELAELQKQADEAAAAENTPDAAFERALDHYDQLVSPASSAETKH